MPGIGTLSYGYIPGASASSVKQIKMATTSWATAFTTTSGTYVDVTNATVTLAGLTASKTYNLVAFCSADMDESAGGVGSTSRLMIDGTAGTESFMISVGVTQQRWHVATHDVKMAVTGATSYIAKLQVLSGNGVLTAEINGSTKTQRITLVAIEA